MTQQPLKILLCETEDNTYTKLTELLSSIQPGFTMSESAAEKIKRSIAVYEPDILLTDHRFWLRDDALEIIDSVRITETIPVLVWANLMNEKILSSIFKTTNIHFVKQTNDVKTLSEILFK